MATSDAPKNCSQANRPRIKRKERKALKRRAEEEFNNTTNKRYPKWRKGWPTLPVAPIETRLDGAAKLVPDRTHRIIGVREILDNFDIKFKRIFFAFRVPVYRTPQRMEDHLTLVITLDMLKQGHMVDKPLYAVRNRLLKHPSTANIRIDFVDFRAE
jgi:hypothetical protein